MNAPDAIERLRRQINAPVPMLDADDARAILDLIERERNGGERAQIVAWLRQEYVDMMDAAHGNDDDILQAEVVNEIADAIAAGAHNPLKN
jgi:hypothetical protein